MRKRSIATLVGLFTAVAGGIIPLHASSMFIDGDVPLGTPTPFSDSSNGLTALFSSSADPGGFATSASFLSWGPEMLSSQGINLTLTVQFYSDAFLTTPATVDWIQMDFGANAAIPLQLVALLGGPGGTQVGSSTATGTTITVAPEGVISFGGPSFDTVELTMLTDPNNPFGIFGVGNISDVPEPDYVWAFPVIGLGLAAWKRQASAR